jgi:hypothetical protein
MRTSLCFSLSTGLVLFAAASAANAGTGPIDLATSATPSAHFGELVAASGDTVAVSGRDASAVFVYVRTAGVWAEAQRIDLASAMPATVGSIALDGDRLAIGLTAKATSAGTTATSSNEVQIWDRSGATFAKTADIVSPYPNSYDGFGLSVSLLGGEVAIGAPGWLPEAYAGPGTVYVYRASGTTFSQVAALHSALAAAHDAFGAKVVLAKGAAGNELMAGGNAHFDGTVSVSNVQRFAESSGGSWSYVGPVDAPYIDFAWDGQTVVYPTSVSTPSPIDTISALTLDAASNAYVLATGATPALVPPGLTPPSVSVVSDAVGQPWSALSPDGSLAMTGPYYFPVTSANAATTLSSSPYYAVVWKKGADASKWTVRAVLGEHFSTLKAKVHDTAAGAFGPDYVLVGATSIDPTKPGHAYIVPITTAAGALGGACSSGFDCPSGSCIDGVCCDGQCAWACESCGADGKCTPTPAGTGCFDKAPVCISNVQTGPVCDGQGRCNADPVQCDPYVCGSLGCGHVCQKDSDCLSGYACDLGAGSGTAHQCVKASTCAPDGHTQVAPDGVTAHDCSPYRCAAASCLSACATSDDCLGQFTCDVASKTCVPDIAVSKGGGCALGQAEVDRSAGGLFALLGAALAASRVRRAGRGSRLGPRGR